MRSPPRGSLLRGALVALALVAAAGPAVAAPADYLFGYGFGTCSCGPDNPPGYLYRFDVNGNMVWQRLLPYSQFGNMNDSRMADRNLKEDALYWLLGGEANVVDGKMRLQKYNAAGDLEWELPLITNTFGFVSANPVCGGVYVADSYNNVGIYRIDGAGNIVWGPSTLGFPTGSASVNWGVSADVTTGGGYATRYDNTTAEGTVIRFDQNGVVLWAVDVPVALWPRGNPLDGGVYVGADSYHMNTYRLDPQGEIEWMKSCVPSCYNYARAVSPLDGSLCIQGGWHNIGRLTMDGQVLWDLGTFGYGSPNSLAFDLGEDALYVGWSEVGENRGFARHRGSDFSRVWHVPAPNGEYWCMMFMGMPSWLEHSPEVTGVVDVPNDQGGKVHVMWEHSDLDQAWSHGIASYTLWRRLMTSEALAAIAGGAQLIRSEPEEATDLGTRTIRLTTDGVQSTYWEYVASIPALGVDHYSYMAPTTSDSMAGSIPYNVFLVDAREAAGSRYHMSLPDSGYSVDNLSPAPPAPFTGAYVAGSTWLHWGPNAEADFKEYAIYRSATSGGPFTRIATRPDTGYADPGPAGNYYRLTAFDVHGNESNFALLTPSGTVGVGEGAALSFALCAVRPNPTRVDRLSVEFVLAREGSARLELMDVAGRRVVGREVGALGIGQHQVDLASGVRLKPGLYLLRLTQGTHSRVGRVAVIE